MVLHIDKIKRRFAKIKWRFILPKRRFVRLKRSFGIIAFSLELAVAACTYKWFPIKTQGIHLREVDLSNIFVLYVV